MNLTSRRTWTHHSGALVTVESARRVDALRLTVVGLVLIATGLAIPGPERPASAVLDVTPSPSMGVYQNSTQNGSERIEEDEPGWNCQTMGNRVCGGN